MLGAMAERGGRHGGGASPGGLRCVHVLLVLVGLLGMHALAPGGAHAAASMTSSAHAASADGPAACAHGHEQAPGGHARHADPVCAAPGIASTPALGDPSPSPVPVATAQDRGRTPPSVAGRAPPDLAALQLLRI